MEQIFDSNSVPVIEVPSVRPSVCSSVRPSVRQSVGLSICRSVTPSIIEVFRSTYCRVSGLVLFDAMLATLTATLTPSDSYTTQKW